MKKRRSIRKKNIRTNVRTWKDDDDYVSNETKTENPNKALLATATSPQTESESTPPPPELVRWSKNN